MTATPRISGLLETSLYVADLDRAAAFYEGVLGLRVMLRSPRLVALDAGRQGVLLLFLAGATSADVVEAGGTIPGHEGTGRLHMAFAVPDGASFLASLWSSMISARGMCRAASSAKRIISTAPSAKFGAWKHASPRSRASASTLLWSKPDVPITHGTPRASAAPTFASTASGVVKSIITSAASRSTSSWPACSKAGARTRPTLPSRP